MLADVHQSPGRTPGVHRMRHVLQSQFSESGRMSRPNLPTTLRDDDAALLNACLSGDEAAWTELVNRYTRLVYSIAFKTGLNEQEAADVVQNVFTIVLRRLESLRHVDRFSAWLITTTHRESWRARRARREQPLDDKFEVMDPDGLVDAQVIKWEHASLTHEALRRLDERCRRLLELLFLREARPAYETIASELDMAVGSIGPIRARCLNRLKGHLADVDIVEPA